MNQETDRSKNESIEEETAGLTYNGNIGLVGKSVDEKTGEGKSATLRTEVIMRNEKNSVGDGRKMAVGGVVGFLFGLSLGAAVAWLTHGFSNGMSWILIPHITFAMTLTGLWTVPCFLLASDDLVVQERPDEGRETVSAPRHVAGLSEKTALPHTAR
jgi:hypothetical protein